MGAALEPSDGALEPSLGVNAALSWVTFAGRAGLAFVATTAVARVLGPSGRGEVTYVVNLVGLLVLVVTCGTAAALVRLRVQEGWTAPRMVTPVLRTSVLAGAILIAGAGVALGFASNRTAVIVIAVTALPLVAIANLTQVASLSDRLALVAWTSLAGIGLYAVFTIITAALDVMTVTNNIVAWALTAVLPLPLMLLTGGLVVRNRSLPTDTRRLVRLSLHSNVAAAAVLAIWRADVVIVEARRGFEELGLYSVAVGTAEIVVTLAIGLRSAVLPHQAVAEPERLIDVMCRVTRVAGLGVT
ncbi:MAG TPA: oligosaccharide flippase family protein, partial [Ilumatobacteraceae bacterium]